MNLYFYVLMGELLGGLNTFNNILSLLNRAF